MDKLLVVCGPTATGKTKLAVLLAREFNGEMISADSRQVYKGLDIGTGKDKEKIGVPLWGIDLVGPKDNFSVAQYLKYANEKIEEIVGRKRLPILTGGTGLYIKAVIDGLPTATVPKNNGLRRELERFSADELFEKLAEIDSSRAAAMNLSDRQNPRRLVRAIEIAISGFKSGFTYPQRDVFQIGLNSQFLAQKIKSRVKKRLAAGVKEEIESLLASGVSWSDQSMNSFAYKEWQRYFEGQESEAEAVRQWTADEVAYSRSQMTWFKRDKRIVWFDIEKIGFEEKVEDLVKKWYKKGDD